ncbi:MAG: hypothetical protein EOM14_16845, partial [Clostridia bacterium]|nr:hypothetical protein [Clostridia bacterium]
MPRKIKRNRPDPEPAEANSTPNDRETAAEIEEEIQDRENNHNEEQPSVEPDIMPYRHSDSDVEAFVPTDFFPTRDIRLKRRRSRKKKNALWAVLISLGVLLLCVGGVYSYIVFLEPSDLFTNNTPVPDSVEVQVVE